MENPLQKYIDGQGDMPNVEQINDNTLAIAANFKAIIELSGIDNEQYELLSKKYFDEVILKLAAMRNKA